MPREAENEDDTKIDRCEIRNHNNWWRWRKKMTQGVKAKMKVTQQAEKSTITDAEVSTTTYKQSQ